jgi:CHAT domain-containing protein
MNKATRVAVVVCAIYATADRPSAQSRSVGVDAIATLREEVQSLAQRGNHRGALERLSLAERTAGARPDPAVAARIELLRSTSLRAIGDRASAERASTRARHLASGIGNEPILIESLLQLSVLLSESGRVPEATRLAEDALARAERAGNEKLLASSLDALARYRAQQGRSVENVDLAARAIAIADRIDDVELAVRARVAQGTGLLALGRFDDALATGERAFEIARGRLISLEASSAFSLAQAHAHVWNLDRATELWNAAIAAYRRSGLKIGVALALRQRVDTMYALGDFDAAARDGEEALPMLESDGSTWAPGLLARLALVEARRGRAEPARDYASRAAVRSTDQASRRFVHNDLGLVGLLTGSADNAEKHFTEVLSVARAMTDPEYEWRARYGLGRVAHMRGNFNGAVQQLDTAVAIVERMRRALPDAGLRASFLSDRTIAHEALIEALAAQSMDPGDAFVRRALLVAETARGRSLADLLAEGDRLPTDPALSAARAGEVAAARRLSDMQRRFMQATSDREQESARADLTSAERDFEALVVRLRREQPAYASLRYPDPLPDDRISAMLADDEALVEFMTGERSGFVWIVRRSGTAMFPIPARDELDSAVRLMNAVMASSDVEAIHASGRRLEELLFGPGRAHLRDARRLIIVPDGPLNRLPFAALRTAEGRWLVEDVAIALTPSATVLGELRARPMARTATAMAAFVAGEPNRIAQLVPGGARIDRRPLVHAAAEVRDGARALGIAAPPAASTEAAVKALPADAVRVVHFAAHAVADEATPRHSGILLEADDREDGWLQMHEIPHLSMQADLVVLATCRSQAGRWLRGEGLLGLSRAFMRAGARGVLAALWEVDDAETRRMMTSFYNGLGDGLRPDDALRQAQLAMIASGGRSADPRSWAAFVATGDVSSPLFTPGPQLSRAPMLIAIAAFVLAIAAIAVWWRGRSAARLSAPPEAAGR